MGMSFHSILGLIPVSHADDICMHHPYVHQSHTSYIHVPTSTRCRVSGLVPYSPGREVEDAFRKHASSMLLQDGSDEVLCYVHACMGPMTQC